MFTPLRSLTLAALFSFAPLSSQAEILVHSGDKIAFLGDSITAAGWAHSDGYVHLVIAGLEANGVHAEPVPAGIGGHKSNDMLARLQHDVIDKHPQWMTLSCGVNDVWHGVKGVPLDDAQAAASTYEQRSPTEPPKGTYEKNITAIIDKAVAAGIKPVILTATVIREDLTTPENAKLVPYNDFLRKLAHDRHLPLADLNAAFQERLKKENKPKSLVLTQDGVHMIAEGDRLMAAGVLEAFGLNAGQLAKAAEAWKALPTRATPTPKPAATPVAAKAASALPGK
jgi:lysophospholipase L1-like esterase